MKCRLCDRPTAAGSGKLCADCAKALQRARGAALGRMSAVATMGAEHAPAPSINLTVMSPGTAPTRSARSMLWVAMGLAAVLVVYVAQRELSGAQAPVSLRTLPALTERGNVEPSPVFTRVEEPSWTTVGDPAKLGAGPAGPERGQASAAAISPKTPGAPGSAKTGAKVAKGTSQDSKSMPVPVPLEYEGGAPKPTETDSQAQLAGGRVAAPAQPVDGAQMLAAAMQKCGSEGLFSKFICEQKAFLQYCEEKWDKDPKCMRKGGER